MHSAIAPSRPNERAALWALIALGMALRLFISWHAVGSNDATYWEYMARHISTQGLFHVYQSDIKMNNPPLPCEWATFALALSQASGVSFYFIFRLPAIIADTGICLLLWRIVSRRKGEAAGLLAAAVYSWCPDAVLISSYHGNTDSIYVFLALAAVYCIAERQAFFTGGLALAFAINIKLIPGLLIFPLFTLCRIRRDCLSFAGGLALGALPFAPPLIGAPEGFYHHVIAFSSHVALWGLTFFYMIINPDSVKYFDAEYGLVSYKAYGKAALFISVCALSIAARYFRFKDTYALAALAMAMFLILTPGFGIQYTAAVVPLLFAADLWIGVLYGMLAGVFALVIYWHFWTGTWPAYSYFNTLYPASSLLFGYAAWTVLIVFCIKHLRRFPRGRNRAMP